MAGRRETKIPTAGPRMGMWPTRREPRRALLPQVLELFAIIGLLVLSYHGVLWCWERTAPKEAKVPKVMGLAEREAVQVLESLGLRAEVVGSKPDEEIAEGAVLAAEPPPERVVKVGRVVRLTLSSGSRWSVVPDVREMSVDRARAWLRKVRLSAGREMARYDDEVPIGYVVAQVPEAGQKVPRRMAVDLWVSKGPAPAITLAEEGRQEEGVRSAEVDFVVPPGARLQEVQIVVRDDGGERTVYRQFHQPGERITRTVSGQGPRVVVRVYLSGEVMQERTF